MILFIECTQIYDILLKQNLISRKPSGKTKASCQLILFQCQRGPNCCYTFALQYISADCIVFSPLVGNAWLFYPLHSNDLLFLLVRLSRCLQFSAMFSSFPSSSSMYFLPHDHITSFFMRPSTSKQPPTEEKKRASQRTNLMYYTVYSSTLRCRKLTEYYYVRIPLGFRAAHSAVSSFSLARIRCTQLFSPFSHHHHASENSRCVSLLFLKKKYTKREWKESCLWERKKPFLFAP